MWIYQYGLLLFGLSAKVLGANLECFSGVDDRTPKPCDKCEGIPIEVMLILDDSSSVRYSFEKEREFAIKFITATQARFSQTRIGSIFFSECMTGPDGWLITDPHPETNGGWNCATGTTQSRYGLQSSESMIEKMTSYDHGMHWGTPLSVGYDWALEEMDQHGTPGQMRVVVMTSDGLPTRPFWPEAVADEKRDANGRLTQGLKKWEMVELCDDKVTEMKNKGIISLTLDVGGQDSQAERNMRRWASEPRDRWSVQGIVDFDQLLARFDDILDRLCFYIDTVNPTSGEKNCVEQGQELLIVGKNLFDMGQDSQIPSQNIVVQSDMYDFGSPHQLTRIRIKGMFETLNGVKFQGSLDKSNWEDLGHQISEESRYACSYQTLNGDWCCIDPSNDICITKDDCFCKNEPDVSEWFAFMDTSGQYSSYRYIRLLKLDQPLMLGEYVDEAEFYGKGSGEQKPKCRFESDVSGDIYYSDASEVGPSSSYTEMKCAMPNTNGVFGDFIVEISRRGTSGPFTNNGRKVRHTDTNCVVPEGNLIPTLPMSPTRSYWVPTPAPNSMVRLEMSFHFYVFFFFLLVNWI